MIFETKTGIFSVAGRLYKNIKFMVSQGIAQAAAASETGLELAMISLGLGESLTLKDTTGKEVKVTKLF